MKEKPNARRVTLAAWWIAINMRADFANGKQETGTSWMWSQIRERRHADA